MDWVLACREGISWHLSILRPNRECVALSHKTSGDGDTDSALIAVSYCMSSLFLQLGVLTLHRQDNPLPPIVRLIKWILQKAKLWSYF